MSEHEAEAFARHHDERAKHGGAGWEFHARAATFLRDAGSRLSAAEAAREASASRLSASEAAREAAERERDEATRIAGEWCAKAAELRRAMITLAETWEHDVSGWRALEAQAMERWAAGVQGAFDTATERGAKANLCRDHAAELRRALAASPRPTPPRPATPDHIQFVHATREQVEAFNASPGRWVIYFEAPGGGRAQTFADLSRFPGVKARPTPPEDAPAMRTPKWDGKPDWLPTAPSTPPEATATDAKRPCEECEGAGILGRGPSPAQCEACGGLGDVPADDPPSPCAWSNTATCPLPTDEEVDCSTRCPGPVPRPQPTDDKPAFPGECVSRECCNWPMYHVRTRACPPAASTTAPRCKTCSDTGYVMAFESIEPGILAPGADPCPDCSEPASLAKREPSPSHPVADGLVGEDRPAPRLSKSASKVASSPPATAKPEETRR